MTSTRLLAIAAVGAATALLAACSSAPGSSPADPSAPTPQPTLTVTPDGPPDPDAFLDDVESIVADLALWHGSWLAADCSLDWSASPAVTETEYCLGVLDSGIDVAISADAVFVAAQSAGLPRDEALEPVATGVSYAAWRGAQWRDADCRTVATPECSELTAGLASDLLSAAEFAQLWQR